MLFRCTFEVKGLNNRVAEAHLLKFTFDRPRPLTFRFDRNYSDGSTPSDSSDMVALGETSVEVADPKIAADLVSGLNTSVDGKFANLAGAEPSAVTFVHNVVDELLGVMSSTVVLLRWRAGLAEGPPVAYHNLKGYYSEDGSVWREVSMLRRIEIRWGITLGPMPQANELCKEVMELRNAGMEEPLGHQLFREAWSHRMLRPASALVIGVAAAEVGFKKLVGSLVPSAQWLIDNVQTRSLPDMLRKFLPTLPVNARFQGKRIRPPEKLVKVLEGAVTQRNRLVHRGHAPPRGKELDAILAAILDLLWICDVYGGQAWAHKYISAGTMHSWEDEKAN